MLRSELTEIIEEGVGVDIPTSEIVDRILALFRQTMDDIDWRIQHTRKGGKNWRRLRWAMSPTDSKGCYFDTPHEEGVTTTYRLAEDMGRSGSLPK